MAINKGRRSSTYYEYVEKWENDPQNNDRLTVIRYANVNEVRSVIALHPEQLGPCLTLEFHRKY